MGCDIHTLVEYKRKVSGNWSSYGYDSVNIGRDYGMFSVMANVRARGEEICIYEPKGFPLDASWATVGAYTYYVNDDYPDEERYVSTKDAQKWVNGGCSKYWDADKKRVTDPDAHSVSWLTTKEFKECLDKWQSIAKYDIDADYWVTLAMMETYESKGLESRIVFWFDN